MNSEPLSESMPRIGKGNWPRRVARSPRHVDRGLVRDRAVHRPARCDVGHREGEAELPERVPALMSDEVDLEKARCLLVPLRPGANRDLGLEQRAGLGMGAAVGREQSPGGREATVDRGGRHRDEAAGLNIAQGRARHRDAAR